MPILESFKEMGVMVTGKVEQGKIAIGTQCVIQPTNLETEVLAIYIEDTEVTYANPGENVRLKLKNVEEDQIHRGFVLSSAVSPCPEVAEFEADVLIVELLEHRPLISAGYSCVFHCHTVMEEVIVTKLVESTELTTKKKVLKPRFVKSGAFVKLRLQLQNSACLEAYSTTPQMGRFTLRDEGKTIAIGKITAIIPNGKPYGGKDGVQNLQS
jgi:peptide chain release factor subunit 3